MLLHINQAKQLGLYFFTVAIEEVASAYQFTALQQQQFTTEVANAINSGKLISRDPLTGGIFKNSVNQTSPYISIDDFNDWLKKDGYKLRWELIKPERAIEPTKTPETAKPSQSGETKGVIATMFEDLHFSYDKWIRHLGDPSNWLKECRIAKGSAGKASATWDPTLIAVALIDRGESPLTL